MRALFFTVFLFCYSVILFCLPDGWDDYFIKQCHEVGIPVTMARAILRKENPELNPRAISRENANGTRDYGLWQMNSRYLWDCFVRDFWDLDEEFKWDDPFHNTYVAVRHIRWLYGMFGREPTMQSRVYCTVLAYNCGYQAVASGKVPSASANYAASVFFSIWRLE